VVEVGGVANVVAEENPRLNASKDMDVVVMTISCDYC